MMMMMLHVYSREDKVKGEDVADDVEDDVIGGNGNEQE